MSARPQQWKGRVKRARRKPHRQHRARRAGQGGPPDWRSKEQPARAKDTAIDVVDEAASSIEYCNWTRLAAAQVTDRGGPLPHRTVIAQSPRIEEQMDHLSPAAMSRSNKRDERRPPLHPHPN